MIERVEGGQGEALIVRTGGFTAEDSRVSKGKPMPLYA